jgi:hypothetical protein
MGLAYKFTTVNYECNIIMKLGANILLLYLTAVGR